MITKEQVLENLEEVKKYIAEAETKKEEKVTVIEIKSIFGSVIFQSSKNSFREAILEAVNSSSNLRDANLRGVDLSGADLSDADLRGVDLRGANLSYANLRDADLRNADLRNADLRNADLSSSNLRDANLRNADLSGAELNYAKFYGRGGTKPLKRSQLQDFLTALGFIIED